MKRNVGMSGMTLLMIFKLLKYSSINNGMYWNESN